MVNIKKFAGQIPAFFMHLIMKHIKLTPSFQEFISLSCNSFYFFCYGIYFAFGKVRAEYHPVNFLKREA